MLSSIVIAEDSIPLLSEVNWRTDVNDEVFEEVSEKLWDIRDFVNGRNFELYDFIDESSFWIIDTLLWDGQLDYDNNRFKGIYNYAKYDFWKDDTYSLNGFQFSGLAKFHGNSELKYKIVDYEVSDVFVNDWITQSEGEAYLEYEIEITLKRRIPVEVYTEFYDDGEFWEGVIDVDGDGIRATWETDMDFGQGLINHNKDCSGVCY